jgi:hypothetical protein
MMTKPVMLVALVVCIIMLGAAAAYSAYGVLNWGVRQPNFDNTSPSSIIRTSLAANSKENFTVSSNKGSNLFHNQTENEEWLTYHHDFFRTGFDSYHRRASQLHRVHFLNVFL